MPARKKIVNSNFILEHSYEAVEIKRSDFKSANRFFNRELSWLAFNWRVLEEAQNIKVPLLERVNFLAISASNLDEFYTVRVAGLRAMVKEKITHPSLDGLSPQQQIEQIEISSRALMQEQQKIWHLLLKELSTVGIHILDNMTVEKDDLKSLENYFLEQIFPIITPLAIDQAHPFPFIASGGYTLALKLKKKLDGSFLEILLPIPPQLPRFHRLQNRSDGEIYFLPLEVMLELFSSKLIPGYEVVGKCSFRLLRDSDLEVEEEAEDLVREFETALKRRRRGEVIRLKISSDAPTELFEIIVESLSVSPEEIIQVNGVIGMMDLSELVIGERPELLWPSFSPRIPERVEDNQGDIFAAIRQKDMLLHHPYETFDTVVGFLQQAARDPDVVAIRQTLYRTSYNSPIVRALCEAAEDGKSVTALVELKARFDEEANIRVSRALERAGAQVVYGFIDWKTHAKISAVVRKEGKSLVTYSHFGTGNYHPITAEFYTDLSLFTCDPELGRDATKVFNYVSGYVEPEALENLSIAPINLKSTILTNLESEIGFAKAGKPAHVWVKLNSLIDSEIVDALYGASKEGVKIDLIVRGICGLRPGIKGLSENIRVKSIVGRFLEHSRIACFGNGGGLLSGKARVYISSADWMGRNLNRRVEALVEIKNSTVKAQIVDQIMVANLQDEEQSWVLQHDGSYLRHNEVNTAPLFNCHKFFVETPSLSGRGLAGSSNMPKKKV